MKKLAAFGIAVIIALGLLIGPTLAEEMNVEAIMKAHVKAIGGTEALDKIKTVKRSATTSMDGVMGQMEGTSEEVFVVGKKSYQHTDFGVYVETSGWNGKTGWAKNSMEGLQDVTGEDLEFLESAAEVSLLATVWRAYGNAALKHLPDETYEGKQYQVLTIVETDIDFYLDPKTGLLAAMSMPFEDPELGEAELLIVTEDYNEYNGVMFPDSTMMVIGDDLIVIESEYTETKINGPVDNAVFEKPAK